MFVTKQLLVAYVFHSMELWKSMGTLLMFVNKSKSIIIAICIKVSRIVIYLYKYKRPETSFIDTF